MAVTNLYPNLPGHLVEFKDGGLQLTTNAETASGKSLLILGTAFDGPINEPVQIDATTVAQLFGSEVNANGYPNGATLTKYAKQAFKNGFTDVRCMRVTGSQAFVEIPKVVTESVEELDANPVSGTIQGNAAVEGLQVTHTPIIGSSLKITTGPDGSGTTIVAGGYTEDDGTFNISAGVISKNSPIYATYQYKDINTTAIDDIVTIADVAAMDTITLFDPSANEGIYVNQYDNANFPATHGFKATLDDGTELVEGTDYKIENGVLTWLTGGAIVDGVNITYEFYKYTLATASDTLSLQDTDQVITLPKTPVAGSVVLTVNGAVVDVADYTVAGNVVSLTAGNFVINDTFVITYKYEEVTTTSEGMIVRAIYGGAVYKDASVVITEITNDAGEVGRKFTFTKPESKRYSNSDLPFYFTSFECPTVGILKQALANYTLNNVFEIITDDEDTTTADFPVFSGTLANGGDDGVVVTNNQMFEALAGKRDAQGYLVEQGAYQILENYNVDYIYPAGVYADSKQTVNPNSSFHYELALLCAVLTYRTKMTHGFIDVKPNSNTTLVGIQKYVAKLLEYNNIHYMKDAEGNDIVDKDGNKMDLGWYTSVVVGPEPVVISDTLGTYYGSPAIAYAALNAGLKPESAPTNKALPGVKGMKYKFSNKQMNELVGNRMVVFKLKNEGTATASSTPFVVDGCTAGAPGSDYARLATVKVVTDVVDQVREVADPFLGEPNTVEQRNALSALISKRLSYLMEQGEILHYEFEISATIQQVVLGECSIALTLVAPQELRKITTVVALRAAA
jgi:hypothetical protein